MHVTNVNGGPQRKPVGRAQLQQNTVTTHLRDLIEGHARRMLYHGGTAEDISDRVAETLGIPAALAEQVCNEMFRVVLYERDRLRNGIMNTLSHAKAVRSDLAEVA